jgi:hypothetical protein
MSFGGEERACVTPDSYRDNSLSAFGGKGLNFLDFCNTFIKKYERKEE